MGGGCVGKCVSGGFKAETPLGRTGVGIRGQKGIATLGLERMTPSHCGQLWEHLEIVWVTRIGDSAVSKVLVDRYDLLVQSSIVAAAGKTDRVIMIGLTTLGHAHRFVHMAYYYLLFVKYLFWYHSILYAS